MINLVVAVAGEARPLVRHFGMSQNRGSTAFRIYNADHLRLVVTGTGKVNSAAGVACLGGLDSRPNQVWLNVGLAGHVSLAIGTGVLARKITDHGSARSWYPPQVPELPGVGGQVTTYDQPVADYPVSTACDMEASAFYSIATRFSTGELVQCYKVISDNRSTGVAAVDGPMAEELIKARIPEIDDLSRNLDTLARGMPGTLHDTGFFDQFTEHWHFTASQQAQLREALRRLSVRAPEDKLEVRSWRHLKNAKSLLEEMNRYLDSVAVRL